MRTAIRTLGFVLLFAAVEINFVLFVDRPLSEYLRTVDHDQPALINFFRAITDYGKSAWYLWPSAAGIALCFIFVRVNRVPMEWRKSLARLGCSLVFLFAAESMAGIVADIIKPLAGRARPVMLLRENVYGFIPFAHGYNWSSFPSGHSTNVFAMMWILTLLVPRGRGLWVFLAVLLGLSRIMVNAHFLSDVVAGAAVGMLTAAAIWRVFNQDGINLLLSGLFPIDRSSKAP